MFYNDYYFSLLSHRHPDYNFGPVTKSYRLNASQEEFYFFPKCPEVILDIEVYMLGGLEMHQVDSTSFTPKRYLFMKQASLFEMENLDDYLAQNGYEKKGGLFESRNMVAFLYNDGMVFAARSCRRNFGEGPETNIK
jgi:hypothetical protein